jgi:hypothetical protein
MQAMVDAVPMVMQVPAERAMQFSISFHSPSQRFPAQRSAQYFQASVPLPKVVSRQWALSIGPAGRKTLGISALRAQNLFGLHRQQIAIEHGGGFHEHFAKAHHRDFHWKSSGLEHPAFDL